MKKVPTVTELIAKAWAFEIAIESLRKGKRVYVENCIMENCFKVHVSETRDQAIEMVHYVDYSTVGLDTANENQ